MKDTTKKEGHTAIFDAKAFCLFASPPCKCGVHESPVRASSKHAHTEKHEKSHNAAICCLVNKHHSKVLKGGHSSNWDGRKGKFGDKAGIDLNCLHVVLDFNLTDKTHLLHQQPW